MNNWHDTPDELTQITHLPFRPIQYPLQIFPGTLILEEYLIEPCGLPAPKRKIAKNCLRALVVVATCVTAIYAGKALDHFVSLIGTVGVVESSSGRLSWFSWLFG